jgi:predicted nucleic acid-binding protein
MIILDTNVISEVMKADPFQPVLGWMESQANSELWITSVTFAEILAGINRLPAGRRREDLNDSLSRILNAGFLDRFLSFDRLAALEYGDLVPQRTAAGRPIAIPDAQIAAIALAHGATLATRNVKDFAGTGVDLVNPWQADTQ